MQSATGKKKVKQIFQTKKDFITCSKLIINELGRCATRSDNAYFDNNEQASLAVFTAVFCFAHAEYNLIKLKLYNNCQSNLLTVFRSVPCEIQRNQSNLLTFKN